jgi:hypothetical protein
MRFNHMVNYIKKAFLTGKQSTQRIILVGQPGGGKSAVAHTSIRELNEEYNMGLRLYDLRVSMLGRTELMGIPMPNVQEKTMEFFPLDLLPKDGAGIILLEELTSAPLSVQTPLYQLVWDRKLWNYVVPEGYMIMATGNRMEDRATAERLSTALASRWTHWELDIHVDDFKRWCMNSNIHPIIPTFIGKCPELLNNFDPKSKAKAFACPRTWELLHNTLQIIAPTVEDLRHALSDPVTRVQLLECTIGTVGEGAGHTMFQFMEVFGRMIDPRLIMDDPDSAPFPKDISEMFAIHGALVNMAEFTNIDHIIRYYKRLPEHMQDFIDKFIIDTRIRLCGTDMSLKKTYSESVTYFKTWATKNREVIMAGA